MATLPVYGSIGLFFRKKGRRFFRFLVLTNELVIIIFSFKINNYKSENR
jgi:hypothetical protein